MKCSNLHPLLLFFFFITSSSCSSDYTPKKFIQCLNSGANSDPTISHVLFTPKDDHYAPILELGLQDQRYVSDEFPKPNIIITPKTETQIRSIVLCAKKVGIAIRVRCGGHDFEGLSFVTRLTNDPFVMVDLINFNQVDVDVPTKTAWIGGGANLGETYYYVTEKSNTLGFTGGVWATVGAGGYISGGGYGPLKRKYGLGGDNVLDVQFMNVDGEILDKDSMGEDLFWAIRGGIASNFGIVLKWKVKVVDVPEIVTVFAVSRTLEQGATQTLYKWQSFAPFTDRDLYLRVQMFNALTESGQKTVRVSFESVFLGRADRLIALLDKDFPELGLKLEDCTEMSYRQSTLFFAGNAAMTYINDPSVLVNRSAIPKISYKAKSDYAKVPIPVHALEGMWELYKELEVGDVTVLMTPYGGRMADIPADATPFPHRAGNLYMMYQGVVLPTGGTAEHQKYLDWLKRLHSYLEPYVSKNPRSSYVNYNDLDIGVGVSSYEEARQWGEMYWEGNFERLVKIKTKVDPDNFFRHEQSIPPLTIFGGKDEL